MNIKLLLAFFLFIFQFSFSQKAKPLKGSVSYDGFLLQDVDVINKTSEKVVKTNEKGEFVIDANANDSLLFYRKNFHLKRMKISSLQLENNNLNVLMLVKPEELDEVVVERVESMSLKGSKEYEQSKLDEYATEKFDNREGYQTMRAGTFVNGLNFANIGKKLLDLFSKEKEPEKESQSEIQFATLAKNTCDPNFFTNNLKLKPEEIELFLQFCDTDPKAKKLIEHHNVLSIMDFLSAKNIEFKKLNN
jgi:hypothetical protein